MAFAPQGRFIFICLAIIGHETVYLSGKRVYLLIEKSISFGIKEYIFLGKRVYLFWEKSISFQTKECIFPESQASPFLGKLRFSRGALMFYVYFCKGFSNDEIVCCYLIYRLAMKVSWCV